MSWVIRSREARRGEAQLRLFCVPHAGVGPSAYRGWTPALPAGVEMAAVLLPGREGRLREPALRDIGRVADAAAEAMADELDRPYALFGHSMGGLVAYELARRFRAAGLGEPVHLFVSGRRAPHMPSRRSAISHLPDDEFVAEVERRYGGIPRQVREHRELMDLLLPTLRADLVAVEGYSPEADRPLSCPVTALGGVSDEETNLEELAGWSGYTTGRFSVQQFEGGHFFVQEKRESVLSLVSRELMSALEGRP